MPHPPARQLLLLIALLLPVFGTTPGTNCWGTVYGLTLDSRFPDGCSASTKCTGIPAPPETLTGTFRLIEVENDENSPYDEYLVTDVHWIAREQRGPDGKDVLITGSGRYEIQGGVVPEHRLQLDLCYGDCQDVGHYDSGYVSGGTEFPEIHIEMPLGAWPDFYPESQIELRAVPFATAE